MPLFLMLFLLLLPLEVRPQFTVDEEVPEGFENLPTSETTLVDVYFTRQYLGSFQATFSYEEDWVEFHQPDKIVDRITRLKKSKTIKNNLSRRLQGNGYKVCLQESEGPHCNYLEPDISGVIFDASKFRVDIYINPKYLLPVGAVGKQYLPPPQKEWASVTNVDGILSKSSQTEAATQINLQNITGFNRARLVTDVLYGNRFEQHLQVDQLAATYETRDEFYQLGYLNTNPFTLLNQEEYFGASLKSNLLARDQIENAQATEISIFLNRSAQVVIKRNGRILMSRLMAPGLQIIDTRSFPEGTYYLDIEINEYGGARINQTKFFTKLNQFPPRDEYVFSFDAGFLTDDGSSEASSLSVTNRALFSGTFKHRFSDIFSYHAGALLARGSESLVAGVLVPYQFLKEFGNLSLDFLGNTTKTYGLSLANQLQITEKLQHIINLSIIDTKESTNLSSTRFLETRYRDTLQLNTRFDFSYDALRSSLIYDYAKNNANRVETVSWRNLYPIQMRHHTRLNLENEFRYNMINNWSIFLGFQINWDPPKKYNAYYRVIHNNFERKKNDLKDDLNSELSASVNHQEDDYDVQASANYQQQQLQNSYNLNSNVRTLYGRGQGFFSRVENKSRSSSRESQWTSNYNLSFGTQLGINKEGVTIGGKQKTESSVTVEVNVPNESSELEFELYINNSYYATVKANEKRLVPLPPYQTYRFKIKETQSSLATIIEVDREVTLYPGTVFPLSWEARRVVVLISKLTDPSGKVLESYRSLDDENIIESDPNGWIQGEIREGSNTLLFESDKGDRCIVRLPNINWKQQVQTFEKIVCEETRNKEGTQI